MKVCLVIPPSGFLLDERVFMSLGILKVGAVLEQAGHSVHCLDLSGVSDYEQAVRNHQCGAEAFGITATTSQMPAAKRIAKILRPRGKVILGGTHVTLTHAAKRGSLAPLEALFDVLVVGDGEAAVFQALRDDAPKLVNGNDPKTDLFLTNQALENLPFPARHLVDVDSYRYEIEGRRTLSLVAQLGCPFACGFCGGRASPSLRRIRTRSSEHIIREMEHLHEAYGARGFMFHDDELNVNPRVVELMNGIADAQVRLGTSWRLRGFAKAELLTDQQAEAMYLAGFRWLLIGFESGDERILKNIQKKATREQNTSAVEICRKAGIKVKALMLLLGHPGESAETVKATKDWLLSVEPEDFDATIITPYPGAPYYDEATETAPGQWTYTAKNGDRLHSLAPDYLEVTDYYKGVPGSYTSHVWTDHLSPEEIVTLRDDLEAEVREKLRIPYPKAQHEASMGQAVIS